MEGEVDEKLSNRVEMFQNRLKKQRDHLRKWAKRRGITAFRLYDRDIPEVPVVVDVYDNYLHVTERFSGADLSQGQEPGELCQIYADAAARTLGVPLERVFTKVKARQKGSTQYEKLAEAQTIIHIEESGLSFEVNLSDYHDTGLFLDHRISRELMASFAFDRRVLNLFGYTGSFGVYCAAAGARSVTNVDLSPTYTAWAERNMENNGFTASMFRSVQSECFDFLSQAKSKGDRYDLIIVDPPTFSNSKRTDRVLDTKRDHGELIRSATALLSKDGLLFFSSNAKGFKLDTKAVPREFAVLDLGPKTIPEDYKKRTPHKAYIIHRRGTQVKLPPLTK